MSPPRGLATSPNLRANGESGTAEFLSPRVLTREAAKVCGELDLRISPQRIRLAVTRYVRDGRSDIDFRTWFIAYADPTGETAVRNVMKAASDGR